MFNYLVSIPLSVLEKDTRYPTTKSKLAALACTLRDANPKGRSFFILVSNEEYDELAAQGVLTVAHPIVDRQMPIERVYGIAVWAPKVGLEEALNAP